MNHSEILTEMQRANEAYIAKSRKELDEKEQGNVIVPMLLLAMSEAHRAGFADAISFLESKAAIKGT